MLCSAVEHVPTRGDTGVHTSKQGHVSPGAVHYTVTVVLPDTMTHSSQQQRHHLTKVEQVPRSLPECPVLGLSTSSTTEATEMQAGSCAGVCTDARFTVSGIMSLLSACVLLLVCEPAGSRTVTWILWLQDSKPRSCSHGGHLCSARL